MAALILVPVAAGHGLKLLVQRPRPEFLVVGPDAGGFSFPSGHALFAALLGGVLVLLAEDLVRPLWLRRALQGVVVLIALAVGASRVYLGAHWPSDVLGGYLAGVLALGGLMWLRDRLPVGRP
jgi:undecaprenyl-diphosphatase